MAEYESENWVEVFRSALMELEHAKMAGRIDATRSEIVTRVEKLRSIPGLHTEERRAIEDAAVSLRFLEREEERFDAEIQRRAVDRALQALRSIAPAILPPEALRTDGT